VLVELVCVLNPPVTLYPAKATSSLWAIFCGMIGIKYGIIQRVLNYVREHTCLMNAVNVLNYLNAAAVVPSIKTERSDASGIPGVNLEKVISIL
jgi:hypothetical protein